jgi:hypothetical protein
MVLRSHSLTAKERVAIYTGGYFARLYDVLGQDYVTVARLIGDDAFRRLARAYLTRFPSRSYSLSFLGTDFPCYLATAARVPRRALLRDVATIENAMTSIFDAEETPVLTPEDFASLPPQEWQSARVRLNGAFGLFELSYSVNPLVTAARTDKTLPVAPRRKTWVAVYRRNYVVWRWDLSEPRFALLQALSKRKTILQAIRAAAQRFKGSPQELESKIFLWFQECVREGLFSAIESDTWTLEKAPKPARASRKRAPRQSGEAPVGEEYRFRQISEAAAPRD